MRGSKRINVVTAFILALLLLIACNSDSAQQEEVEEADEPEEVEEVVTDVAPESDPEEETSDATEDFEKMTMALGHATADSEDSHTHEASLVFKDFIEDATSGNVTIEIHPNGTLGGEDRKSTRLNSSHVAIS